MIQLSEYTTDALLHFADIELNQPDLSAVQVNSALHTVAGWLCSIPAPMVRDTYAEQVYQAHKAVIGKKKYLTDAIGQHISKSIEKQRIPDAAEDEDEDATWKLPPGVTSADIIRDGFYQVIDGRKTGIYFRTGSKDFTSVSNFTITPLFHKMDRDNSARIIEINDGHTSQIVEMPSKALISREQFRVFLFDCGSYFFDGNQQQLDKINQALLRKFPKAYELKTLGWQPSGFFAYYNYAFNGVLKPYNQAGLIEHDGKNYYSPAVSQANDVTDDGDPYENDRYLIYSPPPCDFAHWAQLVKEAYPDHYILMIADVIYCLHRDVHFNVNDNAPHIYFYGPSGSGKSKAAATVSNLFFRNMPAFAMSSGTDNAFAQRLGRFRNVPALLNEFDINRVHPARFNVMKNAFDGEGRERGMGGSARKTETQKVHAVPHLIGQYLVTDDDNSVVNRSIIGKFNLDPNVPIPEKQATAFAAIKELEKTPLGGIITELMPYRAEVKKNYPDTYRSIKNKLNDELKAADLPLNSRLIENYALVPAFIQLFADKVRLPFTVADAYLWAKDAVIAQTQSIAQTDILQEFWNLVESLVDQRVVRQNEHFKREIVRSVKVSTFINGRRGESMVNFGEDRAVMYIKLSSVHTEYQRLSLATSRKPGIDKVSLENYLKDRPYYIGATQSTGFIMYKKDVEGDQKRIVGEKRITKYTSAHIIDIELAHIGGLFTDVDYEENPSPKPDHKPESEPEDKDEFPF